MSSLMHRFSSLLIICLLALALPGYAQKKATDFKIKDGAFWYKGEKMQIHSGEMHYARIPKEYWRHRLQMLKAMGLNTVATYVFWNYHNTAPGKWDFETGNHDLAAFIKLAQEEGLFVILRPGPYACAEWEFGGYPWWLQNNKDLVIRTMNQPFLDSCKVYMNKLAAEVKDLQLSKGGPIIMVQVENEFGSYASQRQDIPMETHKKYNQTIKKMLEDAGFEGPFFTSDGAWLFEGGALPGVLPTANGEGNVDNLKKAVNKYHNNEGPYMVAEFYPGWLDHWAEPFVRIGADQVIAQTEKYLQNNISFNLYMAHGGTNFAFTSGANYNDEHDIQPDITSYDYDCPVTEAGWVTPKYMGIRNLLKKYATYDIPEIPAPIPVVTLPTVRLTRSMDFFDWVKKQDKPVVNDTPLTFEQLGQGSGYVLYSKRFPQPIQGKLSVPGLRDYATVYVNGKKVGVLNRVFNTYEMNINVPFNGRLDILVENMGRINYGAAITENTKGIISPVTINDYAITGDWQMYKVPMNTVPAVDEGSKSVAGHPALYRATFSTNEIGDVFLDMTEWNKGIVFVNGHHLGRYWQVGPQQTLYLPGCWLKKKDNDIVIFEQNNDTIHTQVKTVSTPILDTLKE